MTWFLEEITNSLTAAAARADEIESLDIEQIEVIRALDAGDPLDPDAEALGIRAAKDVVSRDIRRRAKLLNSISAFHSAYLLSAYPNEWMRRVRWGADPSRPEPEPPDLDRPDRWSETHPRVALARTMVEAMRRGPNRAGELFDVVLGLNLALHPFLEGWIVALRQLAAEGRSPGMSR